MNFPKNGTVHKNPQLSPFSHLCLIVIYRISLFESEKNTFNKSPLRMGPLHRQSLTPWKSIRSGKIVPNYSQTVTFVSDIKEWREV